jgi:phage-related minor tail protein
MSFLDSSNGGDLIAMLDGLQSRTDNLGISVHTFANAMTRAFAQATTGGKQFDEVLKSLALRLSNLALRNAFRPLTQGLAVGLNSVLNGMFGTATGGIGGGIIPFAAGGVISAPSYFPLSNGGFGLAGEAGPEAIVPLARGPDGRLGIGMSGGAAPANVTVQIATPDAQSFRRSEAYITGQIARAVARGQRSL